MSKLELQDVLKLNPLELQKWVQSEITDRNNYDKNFNWLGLAESLSSNIRANDNIEEKGRFAETAVEIYEWLASHGNPDHSDSNINSAMLILIYMLSNNFVKPSHPTLGEARLADLFWTDIDLSPEEATIMAKSIIVKHDITSSELEKLKKLRKIKTS